MRRWVLRAVRATLSHPAGLRAVNTLHRRLSLRLRQRFFHLTHDEGWRVAGNWRVDFAGRVLVLPLRRDFPLAWTAAAAFHGYDPELHQLYAALVRSPVPPRVFFDVGASYGLHSLRLLAHGAQVVSFEPNPECHEFFLDCCHANGLSPEIVPAAVGAEPGTATLTAPVGRSYLGSIVPGVDARWGAEVMRLTVPVISLDSFVAARGLTPDLVKIDVEGGDLAVLHGARGVLASARPVVILESWPVPRERHDLLDLFAALGYTVHEVTMAGPGPALARERFLSCRRTNFVAWPSRPAGALARPAPRAAACA
jgi:FkbM family methyltransferase